MESIGNLFLLVLNLLFALRQHRVSALPDHPPPPPPHTNEMPRFGEAIANLSIPVGREAQLTCIVDDLGTYKVAWLRVDTQTILTIHSHVITKNHRIAVTYHDHRTWFLHIKEVRQSDRGWYMCQINTDPMKSQVGFLDVVVPPDILDYQTSTDMSVREGSNVTLKCAASGSPSPNITWRREGGLSIAVQDGTSTSTKEVSSVEGPVLNLTRVSRLHMGAYLCIASNGVPPTVSKRIMLLVHFPPMIWIQNQLVGVMQGDEITLECHSEAFPKSINYWTREDGKEIISHGAKYEPELVDSTYKVQMKLKIKSVVPTDFGAYRCVSKNSHGDTDGTIKLYEIPRPPTTQPTTVTTEVPTTPYKVIVPKVEEVERVIRPPPPPPPQKPLDIEDVPQIPEPRDNTLTRNDKGLKERSKVQENRYEATLDRARFSSRAHHSAMHISLTSHAIWISAFWAHFIISRISA